MTKFVPMPPLLRDMNITAATSSLAKFHKGRADMGLAGKKLAPGLQLTLDKLLLAEQAYRSLIAKAKARQPVFTDGSIFLDASGAVVK